MEEKKKKRNQFNQVEIITQLRYTSKTKLGREANTEMRSSLQSNVHYFLIAVVLTYTYFKINLSHHLYHLFFWTMNFLSVSSFQEDSGLHGLQAEVCIVATNHCSLQAPLRCCILLLFHSEKHETTLRLLGWFCSF